MSEKKTFYTRIKHRRDSSTNWENSDFVPYEGELIVYAPDNAKEEFTKIKIGDGKTAIKDLRFANIIQPLSFTAGLTNNSQKTINFDGLESKNIKFKTLSMINPSDTSFGVSVDPEQNAIVFKVPYRLANPYKLIIGDKEYDGTNSITITAADLGLASAMKFLGHSATEIEDGDTTNPIEINNSSIQVEAGNVILYGQKEFVWNGSSWEELGNEGSYKIVQEPITTSSITDAEEATEFITSFSQNENGNIVDITKGKVVFPKLNITKMTTGGPETTIVADVKNLKDSNHEIIVGTKTIEGSENISVESSNGKIIISSIHDVASKDSNGLMSAEDKEKLDSLNNGNAYKTVQKLIESPTSSGNAVAFIDNIAQNTNGEITATKKLVQFPSLTGGKDEIQENSLISGIIINGYNLNVTSKTLTAGKNITITDTGNQIVIDSKGDGGGAVDEDAIYDGDFVILDCND